MRRATNSAVHNIAEGYGRFEPRDKSRFYKISRGSSYELISPSLVSEALCYCSNKESVDLVDGYKEVIDELDRLIKVVEERKT